MESKYSSKSSLFLMELIIAVLFFAISSAICTQMFVKSHIISQQTINENHAVLWTQNISEVFISRNGDFQVCKNIFKKEESPNTCSALTALSNAYDGTMCFLFDKEWNITKDTTSARYMILSLYSFDETFHYIDICSLQLPAEWYDTSQSDTDTVYSTITDCTALSELLTEQQQWNYHLQVKKYVNKEGGQYE